MEKITTSTTIYFDVPFNERGFAKSLGCKWDIQRKKWYIYSDNVNIKTMNHHYRGILS